MFCPSTIKMINSWKERKKIFQALKSMSEQRHNKTMGEVSVSVTLQISLPCPPRMIYALFPSNVSDPIPKTSILNLTVCHECDKKSETRTLNADC